MTSPLGSLVGRTLTWVPTAAVKDRYDLIAPDKIPLATLDMSSWTSKAKALVSEGTLFMQREGWTQREGWFGQKVAISSGEHGPLLATSHIKWSGTSGQLVFPDGREFRWGTQRAWTDPTGTTVYVQLSGGDFWSSSRTSTAVIHPQAAEIPELSLLLVLGLYNVISEKRAKRAVLMVPMAVFWMVVTVLLVASSSWAMAVLLVASWAMAAGVAVRCAWAH